MLCTDKPLECKICEADMSTVLDTCVLELAPQGVTSVHWECGSLHELTAQGEPQPQFSSWAPLAGSRNCAEPNMEVKGSQLIRWCLFSGKREQWWPQEQAGVVGGWQWQGPTYTKAMLCPREGKGEEEKCDDLRCTEENRWGRLGRYS